MPDSELNQKLARLSQLTSHTVCIGKFFLSTKDIFHFLLFHLGRFEDRLSYDGLFIGTGTTFESIDSHRMLC